MMLGGCFGNISHCDMSCCDQLTNGLYYDALALTTCGRSEFGLAHRCGQDWFYRVTIGHIYVMPALLDAFIGAFVSVFAWKAQAIVLCSRTTS